jgi:hypothetical protein
LSGKPEGKENFGYTGVEEIIIIRWIIRKWNVILWTGFTWLRIRTGDECTFEFHKMH